MPTYTQNAAPDLLQEHADLNHRLDELRAWRNELCQIGQPRFGELGTRLRGIRELLADHFAAEEEGGYFAAALNVAPQLARQAEELRKQHREFLEDLEDMAVRLTSSPARYTSWTDACREFDEFLSRLQAHEDAENEIAQTAFETDVGSAN